MKNALTFLLCCSMFHTAQTQILDYDISTFVRPELYRSTSTIGADINLSNDNNIVDPNTKETDYSARLNGSYTLTKFVNNESNQKFLFTFIDLTGAINNNANNTQDVDFVDLEFRRNVSNRKFGFSNNQKFFEVSYTIDIDAGHYRSSDENVNQLGFYWEVPLFMGKGRIEIVNDAWQALRLLDMLEQASFLKKGMSSDEINALALEIGRIKNARMTDFRLERIYEYEWLSKYLVEQGIIDPENYAVFSAVNDVWFFENYNIIRSGKSFKYGLVPFIDYDVNRFLFSNFDNDNTRFGVIARIEREVYRPSRNKFSFDYTYGLDLGMYRIDPHGETELSSTLDYYAEPRIRATAAYYPSARTNYSVSFLTNYNYSIASDDRAFTTNRLSTSIEGFYQYYASPQLGFTLSGRLALRNNKNDFSNRTNNTNRLRFSTIYRFF